MSTSLRTSGERKYADALPLKLALRDWFPCGRTGRPPHLSTGLRWHRDGIMGPDGNRVHLRLVKVGGVFYVTPQDAEAFVAALNADAPAYESEADVARRSREASDALERLGC